MTTARELAYRVLYQIHSQRAYTNLALQQALRGQAMDVREKALCTEIVYGTVQRKRTLDLWIAPLCSRPLDDLDGRILTILRMTVYQLSFLDKIPAYAALNEAVELAKRAMPKASGFVNGVLRSFLREQKSLEERLALAEVGATSAADALARRHSFPTWLVDAWMTQFGKSRTEDILIALNRKSDLSFRVNALRTSVSLLQSEMEGREIEVHSTPLHPFGVHVSKGGDVEQFAPYQRGEVSVQDIGGMVIVPLLQPNVHHRILDMCAAPGTKTTQIAEAQSDGGVVEAVDIHLHKVKMIRQAAQRLGLSSIHARLADARFLTEDESLIGAFDAILLDTPCSGFGVLRHRPDIRWHRTRDDLDALRTLQRTLLETAVQLVRRGGVIVYSTCTLLPEENDLVVKSVVAASNGTLQMEDIRADLPACLHAYTEADGQGLTLTPELFNTDGFYMARLRRA